MFLAFSVFLSISYSKNFVFNSSFFAHCKFRNVYNTYRNAHKWATVPVLIDVLNTYLE